MLDIKSWLSEFILVLEKEFGDRIDFVGLQGSYARGEATAQSDIDVVVILDQVSLADLDRYDRITLHLPHRELLCGFLSGRAEIMHWASSDLFQFYFDTIPLKGTLDYLRPLIHEQDVQMAIHMGACNLYHMCIHNYVYEKDWDVLKSLYKAASFVMQALYFERSGVYIRKTEELLGKVEPEEKNILLACLELKIKGKGGNFRALSEQLLQWSGQQICQYSPNHKKT